MEINRRDDKGYCQISQFNPNIEFNPKLIEAKGTRLLREKLARGRSRRSVRRGSSRPPAESECLKRKSTSRKTRAQPR
ncbi:hypothetical protein [Heyndrickxia acidicola]|uniref:Uncharacterized protein n=1 Tax=Heyndrickxia acidicola TaxID=209389 RepID=A0ABU6MBM1_9BACI|nr:hypothetical protein [Heyndrickxia acidicola]MED1201787.1 hypothetical protein [Heyndrickxia acidicola]